MARSTVAVRFTGDVASLKRSLGEVDGGFSKLKGAAVAGAAAAGAAVVAFAGTSIKAYTEAETAQSQLTAAFAKFPALAGSNADALRALNSELATKTQFDDDATASAQANLAQFGLTEAQLRQITPLMQDYAAKTGKDLPTAAQDLGKAVMGQGRALKAVGLNLKDTGSAAGNFDQLMGGLTDQVGGFAEVAGDTAAGKSAILQNQFGELQESVGGALVPVLTKLADILVSDVLPAITAAGEFVAEHKELFIALGVGITAALVPAFIAWAISAGTAAVATIAAAAPLIALGVVIAGLAYLIVTHWDTIKNATLTAFNVVKDAIMGAFNWVKENWPLLLAILTGPIGLAVLAISRNWDTIKAGVTAVKDWIVRQWDAVISFFKGLPGKVTRAVSGMWDGIKDGFRNAINGVIDLWNGLRFPSLTVGGGDPLGAFGPSLPKATIGGWDLPHISRLARGGVIDSPMLAMLGDGTGRNRTEIATPEALMRRIVREEGGGTTIVVQGSVLSERDLIATLNRALGKGIR